MDSFFKALEGKKTYIFAVLGAAVQGAVFAGMIEQETANQFLALLGFGGMAALRAAR